MLRRFAGDALKYLTKDIGKGEMAARLSMDALGGLVAAAYTPGDIGDKLIAGTASTIGGAAGGLALGKLGGPGVLGTALDFGGSMMGDMAAQVVADQVMKGKSAVMGQGFKTPYEKMGEEQQKQMAQQIQQQMFAQYGMAVPGLNPQYAVDPTTGMGVA